MGGRVTFGRGTWGCLIWPSRDVVRIRGERLRLIGPCYVALSRRELTTTGSKRSPTETRRRNRATCGAQCT